MATDFYQPPRTLSLLRRVANASFVELFSFLVLLILLTGCTEERTRYVPLPSRTMTSISVANSACPEVPAGAYARDVCMVTAITAEENVNETGDHNDPSTFTLVLV